MTTLKERSSISGDSRMLDEAHCRRIRPSRDHGAAFANVMVATVVALVCGPPPKLADAAQAPTRVLSIGGMDAPSGDWFQRVGNISVADNGWICVADSGRLEIFCYSADGKLQSSMGGQGDGPGELRALSAMEADTMVVAWDPVTGRTTRYGLDGRVAGSERTRPIGFDTGTARHLRNGFLLSVTAARFVHGEWYDPYYRLVLSRHESTDTIAAIRTDAAFWYDAADGVPYGGASTPFGDGGAWSLVGDSALVVANGYSGELTWYEANAAGLAIVRRTQVPVEARSVSDQDIADVEKSLRAELGSAPPRKIVLRAPPSWSGITDLVVADDGDVTYIGSRDRNGRTYWRAVHPDDSLEVVPLPPDFELKAVSDGVFYGVVADEFDVQRVVGIRVER